MPDAVAPYQVEERLVGDARWVAIRARGAEWSYLTAAEAVDLGRQWLKGLAQDWPGHNGCRCRSDSARSLQARSPESMNRALCCKIPKTWSHQLPIMS
jgi:hypothetical protein